MLFAVSTFLGILLALLYLILLVTLGVTCLRKGHWVMFILGIFTLVFWVIGALMAPTSARESSPPPAA
jgi:hypothetical protein